MAGSYKVSENVKILRDFLDSGKDCMFVDKFNQQNVYIAAQCLRAAAKTNGYYHVTISVRKGKIWLINELRVNQG